MIAIGVTNTIGSVFNAYPATGSFSRSALKSKSGVRTPIAGIFTGVVVIVALYGLTPAFYWIPNAGLSAIIIHAVADLVAKPAHVYSLWRISPLEFVIWFATVLVTVFSTIENGIYTSIIASVVLLLVRVARPRGYFLGKVSLTQPGAQELSREVFLPLKSSDNQDSSIGDIVVRPPEPGVIVYRYEESVLFPNSSLLNSVLVDYVKENTRRGKDMSNVSLSDRPWNDPGPRRGHEAEELARDANKPLLKAIVLDFSSISHIDTTGVQALVDTRIEVERWADRRVEFHFANILSPWIRRGLVAGGFGIGQTSLSVPKEVAPIVPYEDLPHEGTHDTSDVESGVKRHVSSIRSRSSRVPATLDATPFFHFDLESAVRAAESGLTYQYASGRSSEEGKHQTD